MCFFSSLRKCSTGWSTPRCWANPPQVKVFANTSQTRRRLHSRWCGNCSRFSRYLLGLPMHSHGLWIWWTILSVTTLPSWPLSFWMMFFCVLPTTNRMLSTSRRYYKSWWSMRSTWGLRNTRSIGAQPISSIRKLGGGIAVTKAGLKKVCGYYKAQNSAISVNSWVSPVAPNDSSRNLQVWCAHWLIWPRKDRRVSGHYINGMRSNNWRIYYALR